MTPFMPQRLLNSQTLHSLTASLTVYSLRLYAPTFGEPWGWTQAYPKVPVRLVPVRLSDGSDGDVWL